MSRVLFEYGLAPTVVIPPSPPRHHFDTTLLKPQRTMITEGAIALLSGLLRPVGYLGAVIPWGAAVTSRTDEVGVAQFVSAMTARSPSIAIVTGDASMTPAGIGGFQSKKTMDLLVYICTTHKRDGYLGRMALDGQGSADLTADPGLHIIMEHVTELMIGQRAGSTSSIKQIVPDREEELYTGEQVTIWLQTYRVEVRTNISEFRTVKQLVTSIHHRLSTNLAEVPPPAAKTSVAIDVQEELS